MFECVTGLRGFEGQGAPPAAAAWRCCRCPDCCHNPLLAFALLAAAPAYRCYCPLLPPLAVVPLPNCC
jgi:hypothetical protein